MGKKDNGGRQRRRLATLWTHGDDVVEMRAVMQFTGGGKEKREKKKNERGEGVFMWCIKGDRERDGKLGLLHFHAPKRSSFGD